MEKHNYEEYEEAEDMMTFVPKDDAIPEIGEEQKDVEQKPAEPKKERKNIFKRAWSGIKWVGRKVRESPAATVIGGLAGSALTFGGVAFMEHRKAKQYAVLQPTAIDVDDDDVELEELTNMEDACAAEDVQTDATLDEHVDEEV